MRMRDEAGAGGVDWIGSTFRTVMGPEASGGAMSIVETISRPGFSPPRHIHHDADEIFYILSGEAAFWVDGALIECGPGESAFVPRGTPHSFLVTSDEPCRHLAIFTPAGMEAFFAEMGARGMSIPEDMDDVIEAGMRYKMTFTGQPMSRT